MHIKLAYAYCDLDRGVGLIYNKLSAATFYMKTSFLCYTSVNLKFFNTFRYKIIDFDDLPDL